jgi:hypothetical protein
MNEVRLLSVFFSGIAEHPRIGVTHIGLYAALYYLYVVNACSNPVSIKRQEVMTLAKIRGIATFHKCMKDLCEAGFIRYEGVKDPGKWSNVWVGS